MISKFRTHDDCDGDETQGLQIITDPMGDIYVRVHPPLFSTGVRFRTSGGGGMSPRTHAALRALAEAIDQDNSERPFSSLVPTKEATTRKVGKSNLPDLAAHLHRQREFSLHTFGPGQRTNGVIDHIRKELVEIEQDPQDAMEWIDVVILGFDGALRAGHDPETLASALVEKQTRNESRTWPDWRTSDPEKAIEHVRDTKEVTNAEA